MLEDLMRTAELLGRDVALTLGERHRKIVRFETHVVAILDRSDIDDVLVEHVQQTIHHTVNSTWPACPLHSQHPLWYEDGAWWCTQSRVRIAPLGALAGTSPSAGDST
jgi:hypothetical protein